MNGADCPFLPDGGQTWALAARSNFARPEITETKAVCYVSFHSAAFRGHSAGIINIETLKGKETDGGNGGNG